MGKTAGDTEEEDSILFGVEDEEDEKAGAAKHLLFNIDDELYGIAIEHVTEIIEMQKITQIPDMPCFIKGVINLRGKVIPVMDLRLRFGMEERTHDDRTCIIIANVDNNAMGFIVDTVAEVHEIAAKDIGPAPEFRANGGREHFIAGIGKVGERVTIVIHVERILRDRDLTAVRQVAQKTA